MQQLFDFMLTQEMPERVIGDKAYDSDKLDQALKELEQENARLKRAVADLTLDKTLLKEALSGKW